MSSLGEKLRKLRREKDWSQTQLAQKIGTHRRLISRYETDAGTPSTETLQKIAEIFGVTTDFLLAESSTKNLASVKVSDKELLEYFEEIEKLDDFDKKALKAIIEAMILKSKMKTMIK
ncbi:MAG: helix-turn-helix domain-containing protein [Bacillota bacterium]